VEIRIDVASTPGTVVPVPRPEVIQALIGRLGDRDANVREAAAFALGAIGGPARPAVPALRRALRDPTAGVKAAAAEALGKIAAAAG
jgi:HEAT repeat protein